jgi:hypothetical protein
VQQEIEETIGKLIGLIEERLTSEGPDYLFDVDDIMQRYSLALVYTCFYKRNDKISFGKRKDRRVRLFEHALNAIQTSPFIQLAIAFPFLRRPLDWCIMTLTKQGVGRKAMLNFVRAQTILGMEARKQLKQLNRRPKRLAPKLTRTTSCCPTGADSSATWSTTSSTSTSTASSPKT